MRANTSTGNGGGGEAGALVDISALLGTTGVHGTTSTTNNSADESEVFGSIVNWKSHSINVRGACSAA